MVFATGGLSIHDVEPRPLVPLHPEHSTVCRFSQYCYFAPSGLLASREIALNGRQGPHPPFHPPHLVLHPAVALSRRGFFQTVELLEPLLPSAMTVPTLKRFLSETGIGFSSVSLSLIA